MRLHLKVQPGRLSTATNRRKPDDDPLCFPLGMLADELGVGLEHEDPAIPRNGRHVGCCEPMTGDTGSNAIGSSPPRKLSQTRKNSASVFTWQMSW